MCAILGEINTAIVVKISKQWLSYKPCSLTNPIKVKTCVNVLKLDIVDYVCNIIWIKRSETKINSKKMNSIMCWATET